MRIHPCKPALILIGALTLETLTGCGGGRSPKGPSPSPIASRIQYTPPSSGAYQLLRNESLSTDTHLVLNLIGPTGTAGRGIAFFLETDADKLSWAKVESSDTELAQSLAFGFSSSDSILKAKAHSGELQVAAILYGSSSWITSPVFTDSEPLARVALDLKPEARPGGVPLSNPAGKAVMLPPNLDEGPKPITLALGTISLQ